MASDITTLLIQMIRAGSTQTDGLAVNSTVLGGAADLLSLAANYVQILGTLEGPVAQGAVSNEVAQIAADQAAGILLAGSASESAALATVSATGAGAVIVVIVSLILAVLTASGGQSSDQSQLWQAFNDAIKADLAIYWFDKLTGSLSSLWTPVGNHLDDLANEGTGGKDVMNHVSNFHDDAMGFVNLLVKGIDPDQYWQVPAQSAGDVPQSSSGTPFWPNNDYGWSYWTFGSWYGQFPARSTVPGSPSGTVSDPRTMAPVLALGIQSYLILESLLNVIDPTQPTLQQFVNQFRGDLAGHPWSYLDFLYEKYQLAVKGIVKTDLPSEDEILGTLWWITQQAGVWTHPSTDPNRDTSESWGAPYPRRPDLQGGVAFSGNGWAWNFIYGASETYPQYGFYGTAQADGPMLRNIFTRSYVVTWMLDPVAGGPPWRTWFRSGSRPAFSSTLAWAPAFG